MFFNKFYILKKRHILLALCLCACVIFAAIYFSVVKPTFTPKPSYCVVIDAGHGGMDGGAVGKVTNVAEAELNLSYAKCLQGLMQDFGFKVVMTRNNNNGLYNPAAQNKKKDDMKKRKAIIDNSNADFVISIHMNSFDAKSQGALAFYGGEAESSKNLASSIQKYFVRYLNNCKSETKLGDYYILNVCHVPAVLVECGYLSNPKEEALLTSDDYKKDVCYSILMGVLDFMR